VVPNDSALFLLFCLDDKFFLCLGLVYFFVFYKSQIVPFFCSLFGVFYDKSQIVQTMSMIVDCFVVVVVVVVVVFFFCFFVFIINS
jgi:hypothetical protein